MTKQDPSAAVKALSAIGDKKLAEELAALEQINSAVDQRSSVQNKSLVERMIYGPSPDPEELTAGSSKNNTAQSKQILSDAIQSLEQGKAFTIDKKLSEDLRKTMANSGAYGFTIPEEFGGSHANYQQLALLEEALAANGLGALAVELSGALTIGAGALMGYGTDTQKQLFLPMIVEGRLMSFALTEVGVGVNARKVGAYVETDPQTNGWRLFAIGNKNKLFITNARHGGLTAIVARIGKQGKQLGLFIIELPEKDVSKGEHGSDYSFSCQSSNTAAFAANVNSRLSFDNFPVPEENRIPADGVEALFYSLAKGRCMLAAMSSGFQRLFAADASHYAKHREGVGGNIIKHELPRLALARILGGSLMSRSLSHLSLQQMENGTSLSGLRDITKTAAATSALESLIASDHVIGGRNFDKNSRVSETRHNMHLFGIVEGEDDLILINMVKEITSKFSNDYLAGLLGIIQSLNETADGKTLPQEERILRITPIIFIKRTTKIFPVLLNLLRNPSSWKLARWIIKNAIIDLLRFPGLLIPVKWKPRYRTLHPNLKRHAHIAERKFRQQRWVYLGMNVFWQLELTRAQIPLQRFAKRIEHLTSMIALCYQTNSNDESEVNIASLQCELLLNKIRHVCILREAFTIERIRKEIAIIGDNLEQDRCSLLQDIKPQDWAHPWN